MAARRYPRYPVGVLFDRTLGRCVALACASALLSACATEAGRGPRVASAGARLDDAVAVEVSERSADGSGPREGVAAAELPPATFREAMPTSLSKTAPAMEYAALSSADCRAEVKRRDLAVAPVKSAQRGVAAGVRITGPMNGVRVVTPPASTKFGVLDCRMALVVDDLTKLLAGAGVVRVSIDNIYRPSAKLPGRKKSSQHAHGLALDVTAFEIAGGRVLSSAAWGASIGDVPCGPEAVMASPTPESVQVRNLVCAIGRAGLFHTMLTPSFDAAHQSHFHFDIKGRTSRTAVR